MYSKSNSLREKMKQLISTWYLTITMIAATVSLMQLPDTLEQINYVSNISWRNKTLLEGRHGHVQQEIKCYCDKTVFVFDSYIEIR